MRRTCTCAIKRAFIVSSDTLAQSTSRNSTRIPITTISTCTSTTTKRSFSSVHALKYPRQATPFSSAHRAKAANQDVREEDLDSLIDEVVVEPLEATGSLSSTSGKSAPLASTWYLSETPASSTSYTQAKETASKAPEVPTPPSKLPTYLKPLWDHLYESPFLDQATINFIDSNAVQENVSDNDMDASVSSWVDWVVVASLRRGREKGIRGASEAVKMAMKDCLKVFDAELAAAEEAAAPPSSSSTPAKRKSKIPPVLIEGLEIAEPQWCLIDGGKAIVHVMTPKARRTWQVEGVASAFSEVTRDYERLGDGQELEEDEYYDTRDEEDYQFGEDRNDRYSAARYDAGSHVQDKRMHRRNGQPRM